MDRGFDQRERARVLNYKFVWISILRLCYLPTNVGQLPWKYFQNIKFHTFRRRDFLREESKLLRI